MANGYSIRRQLEFWRDEPSTKYQLVLIEKLQKELGVEEVVPTTKGKAHDLIQDLNWKLVKKKRYSNNNN